MSDPTSTKPYGGTVALALVAASTFLAYANSFGVPFHLDDAHSIADNVWVRSLGNVGRFFTDVSTFSPLAENRSYRPVLLASYALSHALGGGALWAYHLVSIALALLLALGTGLLVRRLVSATGATPEAAQVFALLATALVAVHPLLSESVVYVSARSSLMAGTFTTLAFLAYVRARERGGGHGAVLALFTLGLFTKLTAVTLPLLLVAYELWIGPRGERQPDEGALARARRLLATHGPTRLVFWLGVPAILALGFALLHEHMVGEGARSARSLISPSSYFLTQNRVLLRYLGLLVWPEDLSADLTMRWSQVFWEGETARAILAHAAIAGLALALVPRQPLVWFGVVWFYVSLSPTSSIIPLSEPATEHRIAIAFPGLVFALVGLASLGWPKLAGSRRRAIAALAAASLALAALGVRTHLRNRVWQTERTLWADVRERSPDNGRAHLNYGLALMGAGDYAGARQAFDACVSSWPRWPFCYINRGVLALRERRIADAQVEIAEAERLRADNVYVQFWKGEIERAAGRFDLAELAYRRTLEIAPGHQLARRGLALAWFELGRFPVAKAELLELDRAQLLDADALFALGFLQNQAGELEAAISAYQRALAFVPNHPRALYNLALIHQSAGRNAEAIPLYQRLLDSGGADDHALFNLTLALWRTGDLERARWVRELLRGRNQAYAGLAQLDF